MIRHTHTYAELEVSRAAFDEIRAALERAGQSDRLDFPTIALDMGGIALVRSDDIPQASVPGADLDAVYRERNLVVALAAKLALQGPMSFAWLGRDESAEEGWQNVVFISLADPFDGKPVQLSWHVPDRELDAFAFLPLVSGERDYHQVRAVTDFGTIRLAWDGHTTEEKYRRLLRWVGALGPVAQADGA